MQQDQQQYPKPHLEERIPAEWPRVVRLCASLTGCPDAAEDLAQETMIEAWRKEASLRNPDALRPWLSGIARNVCLRWIRRRGREAATLDRLTRFDHARALGGSVLDHGGDLALEHEELSLLIDRALGAIPSASRDVVVQHYIDELSHREIAERLSLSENTVAVRLHRGKLALRQALSRPELGATAAEYGLVDPGSIGWQDTRIWCPFCGRHHLAVRLDREAGTISSRCIGPCFSEGIIVGSKPLSEGSGTLTSVKSILRRELVHLDGHYRQLLAADGGYCHECGRHLPVHRWRSINMDRVQIPYDYGLQITCPACGVVDDAPLSHLLLDMPDVQQFWRSHPRIELLPVRVTEVHGRSALLSGFASVDTAERIEVVSASDTFEVLHVDGRSDQ
jgi:RNA polymerase sigma factor (sigma-70 family)